MAIHKQKHLLNSTDDHLGGAAADAGEVNLLGTNDVGAIVQAAAEPIYQSTDIEVAVVQGKVVRRTATGQIQLPDLNAQGNQAISYRQAQTMVSDGPRQGVLAQSAPDHTDAAVKGPGDRGLAEGDKVLDLGDSLVYEVTSIAGGNNGSVVEWDAGTSFDTDVSFFDLSSLSTKYWDSIGGEWIDLGSSDHNQQHDITSSDHLVTANHHGVLYTADASVKTLLLVDSIGNPNVTKGSPLISDGNGAPMWGALRIAAAPQSITGDPAANKLVNMPDNSIGVVISGSDRYLAFKASGSEAYFVELTAP
jgi:hypothetical protein